MKLCIYIAGVGGQGVMFASRLLAQAALEAGEPVLAAETHGMAQRGGSVVTHLKIGDYRGPMVMQGSADVLLGFAEGEGLKSLPFLKSSGTCFLNARDAALPRVLALDATRIAQGLGNVRQANLVLIGFACAHSAFPLPLDTVEAALRATSSADRLATGLAAVRAGHEEGKKRWSGATAEAAATPETSPAG